MRQKELFRTSALCIINRALCFIEVNPSTGGPGKCPGCGGTEFQEDVWHPGYTGCVECLNFHILTSHLKEIEAQWL